MASLTIVCIEMMKTKNRVNANRKTYFCGGNVLYKRLMGNL